MIHTTHMVLIDFIIFSIYMLAILLVGYYYRDKNKNLDDYFLAGRNMKAGHIGLSIVATDVGGGFSIGLSGLGFMMGLSASWLLFTGLVGAWLSGIFIIPRVKRLSIEHNFSTYPDLLQHRYGKSVAVAAAVISGLGYIGFTGGQILAGAKLAAGTIFANVSQFIPISALTFSIITLALVIIVYTVLGGMKAVIMTDTVQWIVLLLGLCCFALPVALMKIGGIHVFFNHLPQEFFSLTNISFKQISTWFLTIIPVWLVAMTLYQRTFACCDEQNAKKAFLIAGLFEYPVLAFLGALLGMCARILLPEAEPEMGLPMLISGFLPMGITGIVVAAYFSAIMSTADSCLLAASSHISQDILRLHTKTDTSAKVSITQSTIITAFVGLVAVIIAITAEKVLDAIMNSYAILAAGLSIPTLGALFWKKATTLAALLAMIVGGTTTLLFLIFPQWSPWNIPAVAWGLLLSAAIFGVTSLKQNKQQLR